jgi:hypothetical protein
MESGHCFYLAANLPVKEPSVPFPSIVLLPRVSTWVTVGQPFSPQSADPIPIRLLVIVEFDIRTVTGAFRPYDGKTPVLPPVIRQLSRFSSALSPEATNPALPLFETALLRAVTSDLDDPYIPVVFLSNRQCSIVALIRPVPPLAGPTKMPMPHWLNAESVTKSWPNTVRSNDRDWSGYRQ